MNMADVKSRMDGLVAEINRHDHLYYVEARPVIADADYDRMYEELLALEKAHPEFVDPNTPTVRVSGKPIPGFASVSHDPPMQSLDKCYEKKDLEQFDAFIRRTLNGVSFHYTVEPKIDGVSMSLLYKDRQLVRAATRGNGTVGDDVTQNVRTIRSIPKTLPESAPATLEVRGEVYMTRDGFVKLNESLDAAGKPTFMNPRNACAGSLKQLDPKVVATRPLDMIVYNPGGTGCDGFAKHTDMIAAFKEWGFPVSPWSRLCTSLEDALAAIDELGAMRNSFRFEIDGAVLKVNELSLHERLGATAHGPRWARAYKYAPERAETVVEAITVQVGRTGVLTPVAELRPVELSGSVISRATLHNADQIAEQDIRVGDHVWLVKAGEVIPAIDGVLKEKRGENVVPYVFPDRCPVCGGNVTRLEDEVAVRCVNPACPAQLQRRLEHFASRDALDVSMLGGKIADILVGREIVRDPLDLFTLDWNKIAELDIGDADAPRKFGKNALNMSKAVEAARALPLERWLFAVGIPNVGVTVAKDIAREHEKFSDLADSAVLRKVIENDTKKGSERKILKIKVEAARAVLAFFASDYGKGFLARLLALGINPAKSEERQAATSGPLVGAGCVLTGALSRPRSEYAKMIAAAGGIIQSSVSSKTRYLIAGPDAIGTSKAKKARELGTEVIDESRLLQLLTATPTQLIQSELF